jgi:hypothetical protein
MGEIQDDGVVHNRLFFDDEQNNHRPLTTLWQGILKN